LGHLVNPTTRTRSHHARTTRNLSFAATFIAVLCSIRPAAHAASTVGYVGFVTAPSDCTATHPANALQSTLDRIDDADADVVRIASGTYQGVFALDTTHANRIIGSGRDSTILANGIYTAVPTLAIHATVGAAVGVSDLSVVRSGGVSMGGIGHRTSIYRTSIGDTAGALGFQAAIRTTGGMLVMEDSIIDMGTRIGAVGVESGNPQNGPDSIGVVVRRDTVVGNGTTQIGVRGSSDSSVEQLDLTVEDSVIDVRGPLSGSAMCERTGAGVVCTFNLERTAMNVAPTTPFSSYPVSSRIVTTALTPPAALFVDPAHQDYRPRMGGPLVDAGSTTFVATSGDLAGATRVRGGNDDGLAVLDLGALELQPLPIPPAPVEPIGEGTAPAPAGDTTKPVLRLNGPAGALAVLRIGRSQFQLGGRTARRALRDTLTERATGRLTLARKVGRRFILVRGAQPLTLAKGSSRLAWSGLWKGRSLPAGTYRVTLTATDAAHNTSAVRSVIVKLANPARRR